MEQIPHTKTIVKGIIIIPNYKKDIHFNTEIIIYIIKIICLTNKCTIINEEQNILYYRDYNMHYNIVCNV